MSYELTQRFFFEAAHTLDRAVEAEGSRRVHGHTYYAELTVTGEPDPKTGMVTDMGHVRALIERVRERLDHHMLDDVEGLGPPTLENLCAFLWRAFESQGCAPTRVVVRRDAVGDSCSLTK